MDAGIFALQVCEDELASYEFSAFGWEVVDTEYESTLLFAALIYIGVSKQRCFRTNPDFAFSIY